MKTFVSDYYQVVPWENGGFKATLGSLGGTPILDVDEYGMDWDRR